MFLLSEARLSPTCKLKRKTLFRNFAFKSALYIVRWRFTFGQHVPSVLLVLMIFIRDNSHPLLAWGDLQYLVCGQILQLKVSKMSKGKRLRKWEQVPVTMQNDKNTKGYSFRRWLWECKMREISMVVLVDGQSVTSVQSGRPPAWLPLARLFLYMMLCFSWSSWSLWWWRWWWRWRCQVQKRKFSQKRWKGATWIYPIYLSFNHKIFATTYCIRNAWLLIKLSWHFL